MVLAYLVPISHHETKEIIQLDLISIKGLVDEIWYQIPFDHMKNDIFFHAAMTKVCPPHLETSIQKQKQKKPFSFY